MTGYKKGRPAGAVFPFALLPRWDYVLTMYGSSILIYLYHMTTKKVHIVKRNGEWLLQKEGTSKPQKTFRLKLDALTEGRKLIAKGHTLVIHGATGKFQKWELPATSSALVKPKPTELYHKRAAGSPAQRITRTELRKLGPVLTQLAEYDKKGRKR